MVAVKKKNNPITILIPLLAVLVIITAVVVKLILPKDTDRPADPADAQYQDSQPQTPNENPEVSEPNPPEVQEPQQTPNNTETPAKPNETEKPKQEPKPETPDQNEPKPEENQESFPGGEWSTILCNPDYALPAGYHETVKLAPVQGDYQMDYRAAPAMKAMIAAAQNDGIDLLICSTYRTTAYQRQLYENRINIVMGEDPSLSYDEAAEVAATINAVPGTSEHETGLAADIVTPEYQRLNENFDQTDAYRWLKEHCKEYGFILRYPKEKTAITKIIYEPWHYRFVGTEHSYKIMDQNLTYEEYVGKAD